MSAGRRGGAFLLVLRAGLCAAALAGVGIFHVWSHTRVTNEGYRLDELRRSREALRAERNRLEIEVATLRAPGRLKTLAQERLGMAPPPPPDPPPPPPAPAEPAVRRAAHREAVALGESLVRHQPE